ncbi:MAG: aminotransferase class III-fold pyridoxal phosphate-dependent enzyme [Ignavibacteriales bacterium]|nr:aminotransferase class III-fold pyridoxal phosphate-dependent enzyme [Ignavibacteriales bacterium]
MTTAPRSPPAFDNGMEFFSTFGGNPVSCAAGLAVLDVMRGRAAPGARRGGSGATSSRGCEGLAGRHPVIGDVRGSGLFLGVELVRDRRRSSRRPREAAYVVERLRERGVLAGTDGPYHNVIKIRPPLCFSESRRRPLRGRPRCCPLRGPRPNRLIFRLLSSDRSYPCSWLTSRGGERRGAESSERLSAPPRSDPKGRRWEISVARAFS